MSAGARWHDAGQYLVEPPDLWTSRLASSFEAVAPRVVTLDGGAEAWLFDGGAWVDPLGLEVAAGAERANGQRTRYAYHDLRAGVFEARARLADMDADGIERASIFPTYGLNVLNIRDDDLHRACVRAYNDGVAEWCAEGDGRRLVPHALIPVSGLDDAVAELERVVQAGFRGIVFGGWPSATRVPDPADDAFWGRCEDAGVVVHLVRGGPANPERATRPRTPAAVGRYMGGDGQPTEMAVDALVTDLVTTKNGNLSWFVLTGILERFPGLRLVLVLGGAGWLATCGELLDWNYRYAQWVPGNGFARLRDLPSDYLRRQVLCTVEPDQRRLDFLSERDRAGAVLWASAYPTSISSWPESAVAVERQCQGVPGDVRDRLLSGNFERTYRGPSSLAGGPA
jgi:predicted TIM-barrel fold metal-dependent hydrolase